MNEGLVFREVDHGLAFVGDFDAFYKSESDPWGQSGAAGPMASYYGLSRLRLGEALRRHLSCGGYRLEVGCGHGYALDQLSNAVRGGQWHGLDVSSRAVQGARKNYPQYRFAVGDIAALKCPHVVARCRYDAVILNQVLWYLLERLDRAVSNCQKLVRPGGLLVVSQAFLRGRQRYGADIADGFHGALALFVRRYPELVLIEAQYDDTDAHHHMDGLLVFRRR